jgi:TATA-binding protein-associated factor
MPTHLVHGALTKMYVDYDGAPWNFPQWKELTGVVHGLFPKDDKELPKGWTRSMADEIESYFNQFGKQPSEDEKIKFASARSEAPGRKAWSDWVKVLWKKKNLHAKIIEILSSENLHPYTLSSQNCALDTWPDASQYVPLAVDPVGLALFGEECLAGDRVRMALRDSTKAMISRTWSVLNNSRSRSEKRMVTLEAEAIEAFKGKIIALIPCIFFSSRRPRQGPPDEGQNHGSHQ